MNYINIYKMSNETNMIFQYKINKVTITKTINLNPDENLENNFKNFQNGNIPKNSQKDNIFYLSRGKSKILLDKNKKVKELNLREGDKILVSFENINNKNEIENIEHIHNVSSANLNEEINPNTNVNPSEPICTKKTKFILIFVSIVLALIVLSLIIYFYKPENDGNNGKKIITDEVENTGNPVSNQETTQKPKLELIFKKEDLVVKKTYPSDRLFIFSGEQLTEMKVEGKQLNESNSYHNFTKTIDFLFITRAANIEKNNETLIEKEWYTGYIAIFNLIIPNKTHDNHVIYDELINNFLNKEKNKFGQRDEYYAMNGSNFCFAKIEFYQNGDIKDVFLPGGFILEHYSYIEEITKLLIPRISKNLYVDNIDNKLNEIIETNKEKDDFNITNNYYEDTTSDYNFENEEEEEQINRLRYLNQRKNKKKYYKIINSKRVLTEDNNNRNNDFNNSNYTNNSYYIEDYLTPPLTKSINYDLREANIINNSMYNKFDIYNDNFTDENELNISDNSYSYLTECSIKGIETDELKLEGGLVNTTIYSIIDEQGFLQSVYEKSTSLMKGPETDNGDDEVDEDTDYLYSQIYNDDNQISLEHARQTDAVEGTQKNNNVSFGITSFYINSSNIINCTEHFINGEINKKLYEYFDSFTYKLYNSSENEISLSSSEDLDKETRFLEEQENNGKSYYGMKRITYMKQIYKYNLIGMKMEGQIYSEMNPSTGVLEAYTIMNFGNKNTKIKIEEQITNSHIILERSNQMAYNLLLLINQSNNELIERSDNYSEIIIGFEQNFTEFFKNYTDYSNLFRQSLNDMYNQVQNFSGAFFYELIDLINRVYDNYTIILEDVQMGEYDFINEIRRVTKEEYINYIYSMIDILENFENKTLIFLSDVDNELDNIEDFQIDLLYDIKDQIYESELIFKKFNRNLFKSIEKGILTFKCDISDYIDLIIGQLLYITDFLSVNINKNEILIKAIDVETRKNVTVKLKNFRNIILPIMELLNNNINDDFEKELNIDNNESIKYISNDKALKFLNNVNSQSTYVINKIKSRINNINIYESYSQNIDVLNNINNKTFIEYINDIYSNVLYKMLNIKPEYLNKSSDINLNKNLLFTISKNITNVVNKEIQEINDYIFSYSNQYLEQNIYNIHYNLYYFRQYFLNKEMSKLLKEFYLLLNRTIKIHFKEMIDYNFKLAIQVFDEEYAYFKEYSSESRRFLTSQFIERYHKYKSKFEQYLLLTFSEDFLNLLEKYFYKLKNDILNYITKKIFSVNYYYFNHEYYNKTFYFNEQANNEILRIIDNINNYFNEINLNSGIKIKAVNLTQAILKPYHNQKIKQLDLYYDFLYAITTDYSMKSSEKDFVYSYWRYLLKGWKNVYLYTKHYKNINLVLKDLKKTDKYLSKETKNIYNKFISKFDKYLNNYISYCQNLFTHLYNFVENKINNSSIKTLIQNYYDIYTRIITNDSNNGLLTKIYNQEKEIKDNIIIYINNFSENIKLLREQYYNLYYLPSYEKFLEYPEEIIYKINQFYNEAEFNINNIKSVINIIHTNRIKYIIKSTNIVIKDFIKHHVNYIKTNINFTYIVDKYYLSKYAELDNLYNNCIKANSYVINYNIPFLDNQNYDEEMSINKKYINDFVSFLETTINNTFINETCANNTGPYNNKTLCQKVKKEFNTSFSKYNFNIIKLREGIYYTKTLLENIDSLFDEYNFHNIIDKEKVQVYDEMLNDKNVLDFYNKINTKIRKINKESIILINDTYDYFLKDFKIKYSIKNDYSPLAKKFEKIISFKDYNYIQAINDNLNETIVNIYSLLNEFNQTLIYQLSIRENYTYYNFNKIYFKDKYNLYKSTIQNQFIKMRKNITKLNNNYVFHNSIRTILSNLQSIKRKYMKDTINDFAKNYDFQLLNISYNLGENIENLMEREYNDYEFNFIYDYVEMFEKYTKSYIDKIINHINSIEKETLENLEDIYSNFYNDLENNASSFINLKFIERLKYNQTKCEKYVNYTESNYSYNLLDDSLYNNISDNINYAYYNCLNNNHEIYLNNSIELYLNDTFNNNNNNITLGEKILYIFNNSNNCYNDLYSLKNNTYYKKTLEMMECFINNYYKLNYSFIYFYTFNDTIEEKLDNITEEINNILLKNNLDENFLYGYLEKQNYSLDPYEIELSDILYDFQDIEFMIHYVNLIKNEEYKNYLGNILISSFNISYSSLVNNFILDELLNDVVISINNRLEIHLDYMTKKIIDEYNYYLLVLNTTDELGYSSKRALIYLYENIKIKLNETIFYLFEDDINFYLNLFYRENKKIFRNNFLNYYFVKGNEYGTKIYKIEDFAYEFILDIKFNNTLDNMSNHLMKNIIISKIEEKLNNLIKTKVQSLYNIVDKYKINIETILNNKATRPLPNDMTHLNELIINYTNLVNNQKNRYYLNISDKPFEILSEFIHEHLEPPLVLIKDQYNSIEERLLNELFNIIDNFPNYYLVVKDLLNLETMNENITLFINYTNETIFDYIDILDKNIKSYINKLIHYTYINGLYYVDSPCFGSFCYNEKEILNNETNTDNIYNNTRRLEQKEKQYILNGINIPDLDKVKINKLKNKKLRNLEEYNSTLGSITENDINSFILDMQAILNEFTKTYLNQEFKDINRFSTIFFDKINNTFLFKLKRSIEMVGVRFKTIFTEESYNIFENRLFKQYNNISKYVNKYSKIIENTKDKFINTLKDSSILIDIMFNVSYTKINTYYQILYQSIQNKLQRIDGDEDNRIWNNIKRLLSGKKEKYTETDVNEDPIKGDFPDQPKFIIKKNEKSIQYVKQLDIFGGKEEYLNNFLNKMFEDAKKGVITDFFKGEIVFDDIKNHFFSYFDSEGNEMTWENMKKKVEKLKLGLSVGGMCSLESKSCNLMINLCFTLFKFKLNKFVFPIKLLPYLELAFSIIPSIKSEICVGVGPELDLTKIKESSFNIEISGETSVGVTVDVGVYTPSLNSPVRLSFNVGLIGILGSCKVGFKLYLYFKDRYKIDLYYEFKAFELSWYVMMQLTFQIKVAKFEISFSFAFYIIQKVFCGLKYEQHNEFTYEYGKSQIDLLKTRTMNGMKYFKQKKNDVIHKFDY